MSRRSPPGQRIRHWRRTVKSEIPSTCIRSHLPADFPRRPAGNLAGSQTSSTAHRILRWPAGNFVSPSGNQTALPISSTARWNPRWLADFFDGRLVPKDTLDGLPSGAVRFARGTAHQAVGAVDHVRGPRPTFPVNADAAVRCRARYALTPLLFRCASQKTALA